jgi:hypothetical protein
MRALCGAIITAGALICLGLTAIGIGLRYQTYPYLNPQDPTQHQWVAFKYLDTSLMAVLVAGVATLLVGLATAFLGLAYHHHRRHHEMLHLHGRTPERTVP